MTSQRAAISQDLEKPRTAGRPAAKVLTEEIITDAAKRLLKRDGEFTMVTLAKELHVAPSSLYNHVSSRDEVLANISDSVVKEISVESLIDAHNRLPQQENIMSATGLWIEATTQWAKSYRAAFSATPELIPHLAITPVHQAPQTLAMYEQLIKTFVAFGFSHGLALSTIEALESFLLGSALDATAPPNIYDPGKFAQEHPEMATAYRELEQLRTSPAESAFNLGLHALLIRFSAYVCPAQLPY